MVWIISRILPSNPCCVNILRSPQLFALRKALARVDWVVATATKLREKEHKHLATSVAQGAASVGDGGCMLMLVGGSLFLSWLCRGVGYVMMCHANNNEHDIVMMMKKMKKTMMMRMMVMMMMKMHD